MTTLILKAVPNSKGAIHYDEVGGKKVRRGGRRVVEPVAPEPVVIKNYWDRASALLALNECGFDEVSAEPYRNEEQEESVTNAIRLAAQAFDELSVLTGIPRGNLGKHGLKLRLEGCDGMLGGTYKALDRTITIAGKTMQESVAHEWAHYLDNVLSQYDPSFSSGNEVPYASEQIARSLKANPDGTVTCGLTMRSATGTALAKVCEAFYNERVATNAAGDLGHREGLRPKLQDATLSLHGVSELVDQHDANKDPYWAFAPEMFARSFVAYLTDRAKERKVHGPLLRLDRDGAARAAEPWQPQGEVREKLRSAFDGLMEAIRTDQRILKSMSTTLILKSAVPNKKGQVHYETVGDKRVRKWGKRQDTRVDKLLTSGRAEINKVGRKYQVRVKPVGNVRYRTLDSHGTLKDAKWQVHDHFHETVEPQAVEAKKDYYNVGAKIGGARKDIASSREKFLKAPDAVKLEKLEKEDPDQAARSVNKANLWPKPDIDDFRKPHPDDPFLALIALGTYGAIAPKCEGHTAEDRKNYLAAMNYINTLVMGSTSGSECSDRMRAWYNSMAVSVKAARDKKNGYPFTEPTIAQKEEVLHAVALGPRFIKWLGGASKMNLGGIYPQSHYNLGHNCQDLKSYKDETNRRAMIDRYWKKCDERFGASEPKPVTKKDVDAKAKKDAERWERTVPTAYERKGGKAITIRRPEDYLTRFRLRGVEFGNWMDHDSSRVHVDRCAEAFQDMAEVLGMESGDVSLNGRLALAFGARGKGWGAAHYEPGKVVINLTKGGGAGSLGHEWGHFLDNVIAKLHPETGAEFASDAKWQNLVKSESPSIRALGEVMQQIQNGTVIGPIKVDKALGKNLSSTVASEIIARHPNDPQGAYDELAVHPRLGGAPNHGASNRIQGAHLIGARYDVDTITGMLPAENYLKDSRAMSNTVTNSYWTRGHELFARAFETYLYDAFKEKNRRNNYLVEPGINAEGSPYPKGAERAALKVKFDALIAAIHSEQLLKKAMSQYIPNVLHLDKPLDLDGASRLMGAVAKDEARPWLHNFDQHPDFHKSQIMDHYRTHGDEANGRYYLETLAPPSGWLHLARAAGYDGIDGEVHGTVKKGIKLVLIAESK